MHENMTNKNYVKTQYSNDELLKFRKEFHAKYSTSRISYHDWIFNAFTLEEGMTILDVGSGNGDFWKERLHNAPICDFTFSDASAGMVSLMKDTFKDTNVTIKQLDVTRLPYDDNTFDVVIATSMLYHIADISKALSELSRVLKTGGKLYASTYSIHGFSGFIFDLIRQVKPENNNEWSVSFSLDNGHDELSPFFKEIATHRFPDSLVVSNVDDLVRFIDSLTSVDDINEMEKEHLLKLLEPSKNSDGNIEIAKGYGMFVARK